MKGTRLLKPDCAQPYFSLNPRAISWLPAPEANLTNTSASVCPCAFLPAEALHGQSSLSIAHAKANQRAYASPHP